MDSGGPTNYQQMLMRNGKRIAIIGFIPFIIYFIFSMVLRIEYSFSRSETVVLAIPILILAMPIAVGIGMYMTALKGADDDQRNDKQFGRELRVIDAKKAKQSAADMNHEINLALLSLANASQGRTHERWLKLIDAHSHVTNGMMLMSQQLADNPRYDEIMAQFMKMQNQLRTVDPNKEMDPDKVFATLERISQMLFAKKTGIRLEDI